MFGHDVGRIRLAFDRLSIKCGREAILKTGLPLHQRNRGCGNCLIENDVIGGLIAIRLEREITRNDHVASLFFVFIRHRILCDDRHTVGDQSQRTAETNKFTIHVFSYS